MPHDLKGQVVEVGQIVRMDFKVTMVHQAEDYCNMNLESVQGMPPSGAKTVLSAVNTRQVEVVRKADWRMTDDVFLKHATEEESI